MSDNDTDYGNLSQPLDQLHPNERGKVKSNYLRGTIAEGLTGPVTGAISEADNNLTKFHGIYMQDDRDLRDERRRQKLEPAYQFMIRLRMPAGVCTPEQWLKLDELARTHANGTLRITTRQTFQFHGVLKGDLKPTMQGIHQALLDTIAACGDDNRGVVASANPHQSALHKQMHELAKQVSNHLRPQTRAYHEIWLDEQRVATSDDDNVEPIYGKTYLPRKFKIGFAAPPTNDVDIFSQDLGFIAIADEAGELAGFNVCVGGGMGRTDNDDRTYPRLADVIGFCRPDQVVDVAEKIVTIQRDHGNRVDRSQARMKYTIDRFGLDWFKAELANRLGNALEPARDYTFTHNGDRYGWVQGEGGNWHYTLFIENGRVRDRDDLPLMTGLRELARIHTGEFRLTCNQNLIIANVSEQARSDVDVLLKQYRLHNTTHHSALRLNSMACVAFPTCGLAMAESERYLPSLIGKLETVMEEAGLADDAITVRMSGCPNGCSRPYIAEIGFTGRGPGKYNVYLGGGFQGQRLNRLYLENVGEEKILDALTPLIHQYARQRLPGEPFGDFVIREGIVREVTTGKDFNT